MGDGDDGSAGVTAIRGAGGVDGGDSEGERKRDAVPSIALMTDARGEDEGAGVGRASLNGEGGPNGEDDGVPLRMRGDGDGLFFFIANGLLPPSPSAMSARGRRGGEPRAPSSLPGSGESGLVIKNESMLFFSPTVRIRIRIRVRVRVRVVRVTNVDSADPLATNWVAAPLAGCRRG